MTIDTLKCFILVAEHLSFARAAEALYISQPAVTKQIHSLERELGVPLLIRSTRHVELTPAGMSFYRDAKEIVLKSQIAIQRVQRQNATSDTIRIGVSNPITLCYLAPILKKLRAKYPEIRPNVDVLGYKSARSLFLEQKLDLLLYFQENMPKKEEIRFMELEQDELSCLLPAQHPLAERESIAIEALAEVPVIACNPLNAPLSIAAFQRRLLEQRAVDNVLYCDSIEVAHCMVSAGLGVAILPNLLILNTPAFASVPLAGERPLSFGVFYHRRERNRAVSKVLSLL